ncbi:hypothetical protein Bca4012_001735 [Brassica carinata]|uniref:Uncharacterized protein n=4 Tax=Brassica TaxID=3705 RepID=A0A0D3B4B2_BRAOL|nr:hypothetical protein Bca52824_004070 [Brassica carinata]CAF1699662.1 unnamed protein product [Brassica napus]CDY23974.1 BnaC03g17170D [Brassica napus]VDC88586.1 unnamed protein product [Brassica oleracea]
MRKSETRANHVADAKSSSTHDLMMGRFLPAAKALTLDTPLVRKPTKPEEQARQMTKNVAAVKEKQNKTEQNPYRFRHSPDQQEEDWSTSDMMASGQPIEAVNEDKRRLKLNGSVAQGESLSESSVPEGKEKVETLAASDILLRRKAWDERRTFDAVLALEIC